MSTAEKQKFKPSIEDVKTNQNLGSSASTATGMTQNYHDQRDITLRTSHSHYTQQLYQLPLLPRPVHLSDDARVTKKRRVIKKKRSLALEQNDVEPATKIDAQKKPAYNAPRLTKNQVLNMLNRTEVYTYKYPDGKVVPYFLPFKGHMGILCQCSRLYMDRRKGRDHILNCLTTLPLQTHKLGHPIENTGIPAIATNSEDYQSLLTLPKFYTYSGLQNCLCLRMHLQHSFVACICGVVKRYDTIQTEHCKECHYASIFFKTSREPIPCGNSTGNLAIETERYSGLKESSEQIKAEFCKGGATIMPQTDALLGQPARMPTIEGYFPYTIQVHEKSVQYWFPDGDTIEEVKRLDIKLVEHWSALKTWMDEDDTEKEGYGGFPIQCDRYLIHLDFKDDFSTNELWTKFSNASGYTKASMLVVLELAEEMTRNFLGEEFEAGEIGTPSLILCTTETNQGIHLDVGDENHKQFGLHISGNQASTIVFKEDLKQAILTFEDVMKLVNIGIDTLGEGCEWMKKESLPDTLQQVQTNIGPRSQSVKLLENGFGKLFQFHKPGHKVMRKRKLYWTSSKIINCPAGTVYCMDGGIVHAGSGNNGDLRTLLFWTWTRKKKEEQKEKEGYDKDDQQGYDKDEQQTKLSLMVQITADCWDLVNDDTKRYLLYAIYFCYVTSEEPYLKSAPDMLTAFPRISSFLLALNGNPKLSYSEVGTADHRVELEELLTERFGLKKTGQ